LLSFERTSGQYMLFETIKMQINLGIISPPQPNPCGVQHTKQHKIEVSQFHIVSPRCDGGVCTPPPWPNHISYPQTLALSRMMDLVVTWSNGNLLEIYTPRTQMGPLVLIGV